MIGIILLTDPFSDYKGINDFIGVNLALLSAIMFNIGFIAIRRVKKEIHAWQIVFFFTITNLFFSPFCVLAENTYKHRTSYFDFYDLQL